MLLCVTPNPAIDRTLVVPGYGVGGVFRPQQALAAAGGKGINVARAAQGLGAKAVCAGFLAGHSGRYILDQLEVEQIPGAWTLLDHDETRTCIILVDPAREQTTVVNERGPQTTDDDWAHLQEDILHAAHNAYAVAFSGSLPPNPSTSGFRDLIRHLIEAGRRVWVDTSGDALRAAVEVPGAAIKINDDEIGALLGAKPQTPTGVAKAAAELSAQMGSFVVVTMGARGAVLALDGERWHAAPPPIQALSAVGSGDSFLAGLLVALERGDTPADALCAAVAAGSANALSIGGGRFARADFERLFAQTVVTSV